MQDTDFYDELEELLAKEFKDAIGNKRHILGKANKSEDNLDGVEDSGEVGEVGEDGEDLSVFNKMCVFSGRMDMVSDQFDEYWEKDANNGFLSYEKMKYVVNKR